MSEAAQVGGATRRPSVVVLPMTAVHAPRVLEIYGEGIATGDATFESVVPDWVTFDAGHLPDARFVALVDGEVAGWVALSPYSSRAVYRGVAWESVYVAAASRGQGIGRVLLEAAMAKAQAAGYWTLLAGIEVENRSSLALHARAGFRHLGTHERLGRDPVGRWRDVAILEWRSSEPA